MKLKQIALVIITGGLWLIPMIFSKLFNSSDDTNKPDNNISQMDNQSSDISTNKDDMVKNIVDVSSMAYVLDETQKTDLNLTPLEGDDEESDEEFDFS